jgi:hypothetical protein
VKKLGPRVRDVRFLPEGSDPRSPTCEGLVIIRGVKNYQEVKDYEVVIPNDPSVSICEAFVHLWGFPVPPVALDMPLLVSAHPMGPNPGLSYSNLCSVLSRLGKKLGWKPTQSMPKSMKIAAITRGARANLPPDQMRLIAHHKSDAYRRYLKPTSFDRCRLLLSLVPHPAAIGHAIPADIMAVQPLEMYAVQRAKMCIPVALPPLCQSARKAKSNICMRKVKPLFIKLSKHVSDGAKT